MVLNKGEVVLNGKISEIKEKYRINKIYISFESVKEKDDFLRSSSFNVENETDTDIYIALDNNNIKKQILDVLHQNNILPIKIEMLETPIEEILMEMVK